MKKTITLADRVRVKLQKLGLTERKATEFAKGLVPLIKSVIKSETKLQARAGDLALAQYEAIKPVKLGKAIKVNGHTLRLDLLAPLEGLQGIELLRVMDGLSSTATYLVAAVKGEQGILAIRQLTEDYYNVKFYPTMDYWDKTEDDLTALGGKDYCLRAHYERMHFGTDALEGLLNLLADEAKPKSRMKKLVDRFLTVTTEPLLKAFGYLHEKVAA